MVGLLTFREELGKFSRSSLLKNLNSESAFCVRTIQSSIRLVKILPAILEITFWMFLSVIGGQKIVVRSNLYEINLHEFKEETIAEL